MKSPLQAYTHRYLVFLFLFTASSVLAQANTYLHQRKDSLRIICNENGSDAYIFADERKNSSRHITRLVIRNNHRYQLVLEKTENHDKVLRLRDSINNIVGTILLKERYNIIFPDGEKLTWYDRDSRGEWGYQKNNQYVVKGQKNNGAYSTRFVLDDLSESNPNAEAIKIFFMWRAMWEIHPRNYEAIGAIGAVARILMMIPH